VRPVRSAQIRIPGHAEGQAVHHQDTKAPGRADVSWCLGALVVRCELRRAKRRSVHHQDTKAPTRPDVPLCLGDLVVSPPVSPSAMMANRSVHHQDTKARERAAVSWCLGSLVVRCEPRRAKRRSVHRQDTKAPTRPDVPLCLGALLPSPPVSPSAMMANGCSAFGLRSRLR
jgi:hypothetical protein